MGVGVVERARLNIDDAGQGFLVAIEEPRSAGAAELAAAAAAGARSANSHDHTSMARGVRHPLITG